MRINHNCCIKLVRLVIFIHIFYLFTYLFIQQIYLLNFLKHAAQPPLFSPPHNAMYFLLLYFWFTK